jgi:hypothetical protein
VAVLGKKNSQATYPRLIGINDYPYYCQILSALLNRHPDGVMKESSHWRSLLHIEFGGMMDDRMHDDGRYNTPS